MHETKSVFHLNRVCVASLNKNDFIFLHLPFTVFCCGVCMFACVCARLLWFDHRHRYHHHQTELNINVVCRTFRALSQNATVIILPFVDVSLSRKLFFSSFLSPPSSMPDSMSVCHRRQILPVSLYFSSTIFCVNSKTTLTAQGTLKDFSSITNERRKTF